MCVCVCDGMLYCSDELVNRIRHASLRADLGARQYGGSAVNGVVHKALSHYIGLWTAADGSGISPKVLKHVSTGE